MQNKNKSKKVQEVCDENGRAAASVGLTQAHVQYVAQVQQAARGGGKNGQTRSAEWYAAQEAKKKKEKDEKSARASVGPRCCARCGSYAHACAEALEKQMLKLLAEGPWRARALGRPLTRGDARKGYAGPLTGKAKKKQDEDKGARSSPLANGLTAAPLRQRPRRSGKRRRRPSSTRRTLLCR